MNNIIDITPRIEASRLSNLSPLHQGCVKSDNALKLINDALDILSKVINRITEREDDK